MAAKPLAHVRPHNDDELTLKMVRDAIPAHYFKQNTVKSTMYALRDIVQLIIGGLVQYYVGLPAAAAAVNALGGSTLTWAVVYLVEWNVYWFIQGLSGTGLWVMAHECGHRAFSPSVFINDAVGIVLHSALLVPYHSWRISHGNHHKHTNHLTEDTVFVPEKVEAKAASVREVWNESPLASLLGMIQMLLLGWPAYLIANVTGQKYDRRANHFEPASPLFRVRERPDIVKSDIGIAFAFAGLYFASQKFGLLAVLGYYFVPYLWVNHWLVLITYLQHTDVRLAHFSAEKWNFLRGALATADRDFGPVLNWFLHHINDSHVVHHAFSTMPFYNAIEVTRKHIKPVLGEFYVFDDRSIFTSLYESWTKCRYVVPSEGVAYYKQ